MLMVGDKEKIEELFATWLAQNAPSAHLSELYFCYSEIEAYCLKIKVLRKPLFETIDWLNTGRLYCLPDVFPMGK